MDAACAGRPGLVLVEGAAGIGKTALVEHFLLAQRARADQHSPRVLRVTGVSRESGLALGSPSSSSGRIQPTPACPSRCRPRRYWTPAVSSTASGRPDRSAVRPSTDRPTRAMGGRDSRVRACLAQQKRHDAAMRHQGERATLAPRRRRLVSSGSDWAARRAVKTGRRAASQSADGALLHHPVRASPGYPRKCTP
ncbi:ATP-binding protein [Streptomyces sp. 5-6(2022)]|uniref:ATP-binding protein n=1 Tax=Streptomyces sp. 5-6(2022) TaxID=2936510 RepID=UPI0023B94680|nr:ATP-binding protein [Streptomyces sp. 5-6(2022)]